MTQDEAHGPLSCEGYLPGILVKGAPLAFAPPMKAPEYRLPLHTNKGSRKAAH